MMKKQISNTLILKSDKGDFETYYLNSMLENGINAEPIFKKVNKFIWYFLIIHVQKLKLPCCYFWYGDWKRKIHNYDNVIIFDRNYNWNIINYIHKKNPRCRIIVWYWNPLSQIERVPNKYRKICEEWSFDPDDCIRYELNYNTQFSFANLRKQSASPIEYDIYFLGNDKGRAFLIDKINKIVSKFGKKTLFFVVRDKTSKKGDSYVDYSIPYKENLRFLKKSKCILEIAQKNQKGLTVRCVEAILLNKKVITNNEKVKEYDFYNANNFLVLNKDTDDMEIIRFLEGDTSELDNSIAMNYEFMNWLKRFNLK